MTGAWRPINEAKKDGTTIWAVLRSDLSRRMDTKLDSFAYYQRFPRINGERSEKSTISSVSLKKTSLLASGLFVSGLY